MEVASASAGVSTFHFRRFFVSTKLDPLSKQPSPFIETRSVGYYVHAFPPLRPIFSLRSQCMPPLRPVFSLRSQCMPEGVARSKDGEIPIYAEEESPNSPGVQVTKVASTTGIRNGSTLAQANAQLSEEILPPNFIYLMELGFDLENLKKITRRVPAFARLSTERKIKPLVEFLVHLGMSQYQVRSVLRKSPVLCGISMEENLLPTMAYLESLGIDDSRWKWIIYRFPALLTFSRPRLKEVADYFSGLGVPPEKLGNLLTQYPQVFGLSVESKIKPTTQFLSTKGFTDEEIVTISSRFANIYSLHLERNLIPKWEFFLQMGYPRDDIVKFPMYFGCSLEGRIKPRFNLVREYGIPFKLSRLLTLGDEELKRILRRKLETGR